MADEAAGEYLPIEDYGIIGDLHTIALVGMNASIDFLSFPHFDSPTIFGALLDAENGGRFQIRPCLEQGVQKQLYLPDTNVLLTRFLSDDGVSEISDFMPIFGDGDAHHHQVIRRVKCVRGAITYDMVCDPRFDYGRIDHRVTPIDEGAVFTPSAPTSVSALRLWAQVPIRLDAGAATAQFRLRAGETAQFVLEDAAAADLSPVTPTSCTEAFKQTSDFWRAWIRQSKYTGRWRETVNRSALVLKLLFSRPHGSIVAAPTFGLPEEIGGERNWDYRYTWIRDASFTIYALMRLGYTEEAGSFMHWIVDRAADLNPDGSMQIMYGIDGRKELSEETLDHWQGYRNSRPVRVGNGAYDQLQLDIYGELMDSVYIYNKYGEPISHDLWQNLIRLINWVCDNWEQPDEGIWEVRGGRRNFLYSRVMTWVAVDRGVRLALKRSFPAPLDRWIRTRNKMYQDIFTNFWDADRRAFVQHSGSATLDGSTLLMPMVKLISPTDPRWISTLRAIEEDLVEDSLVYRYRTAHAASDGLAGDEGTFNMVSFWYAEVLARSGDPRKARYVFEKMLGYANHLGLYAEELGPHGEQLGNFPQAFTHLGLISAAYAIDRKLSDTAWIG